MSLLLWGGGAYARDKNTSARVCGKNAGGYLCVRGGGDIFARHYGISKGSSVLGLAYSQLASAFLLALNLAFLVKTFYSASKAS